MIMPQGQIDIYPPTEDDPYITIVFFNEDGDDCEIVRVLPSEEK